jgi:hypothetical protein
MTDHSLLKPCRPFADDPQGIWAQSDEPSLSFRGATFVANPESIQPLEHSEEWIPDSRYAASGMTSHLHILFIPRHALSFSRRSLRPSDA